MDCTAQAPYDARTVANFILDVADEHGLSVSQLSLLKLIYFAHGWYLAQTSKPLVFHEFEAWQYGPVIKVVRDEFARFGEKPITGRAFVLDLISGDRHLASPRLTSDDEKFVRAIFKAYHQYDPWQLSSITHEANSPWDRIWNAQRPLGRMALRIRNDDIKTYFRTLPQRFSHS
jgi:uncharacterized phage-associated protein